MDVLNKQVCSNDFIKTVDGLAHDDYYTAFVFNTSEFSLQVIKRTTGFSDGKGCYLKDTETTLLIIDTNDYFCLPGNFDGREFNGTYNELIEYIKVNAKLKVTDFEFKTGIANTRTKQTGIYHTAIKENGNWTVTDKYSVEKRNAY